MDQAHQQTDQELKKLEKRLAKTYGQAAIELQEKFEDYMRRFAIKDEIKRQKVASGEITHDEYIQWRYGQICIGQRWAEMVQTLTEDLVNVDKIAMSMVNEFTPEVYALNHNYGTFEAEAGSMIDTSYTLYDRDTVNYLLKEEPDLLPRPKVDIPKDTAWNKKHITNAITQGILQGESIGQIAKRLENAVGMDHRAAVRNARTATTGAENKGRIDAYKRAAKMGIKISKVWMATLDNRTRHSHRQMDGQKIVVEEGSKEEPKFPNGCRYPGDPNAPAQEVYNCRCTLVAQVGGSDVDLSDISERNTRKLNGMSYEEWKEGKPAPSKPKKKPTPKPKPEKLEKIEKPETKPVSKPEKPGLKIKQKQPAKEIKKKAKPEESKKYPDTFEGKMQRIQDRVKAKGKPDEEDLIEAGKLIAAQHKSAPNVKKYGAELAKAKEESENLYKEYMKTKDKKIGFQWVAANNRLEELQKQSGDKLALDLKDTLSKVRPMGAEGLDLNGHLNGSRSPAKKTVMNAYDCYPTEWVKRSMEQGNLTPKKVERGYYSKFEKTIAISGEGNGRLSTAIHELGHRMEHTVPGLRDAEKDFYDRRTKGETLKWMGEGYGKKEVTRKDKFLNSYMGKDYGGSAYELASMGFESAYTDPGTLAKDPDMEAWVYGMLALM